MPALCRPVPEGGVGFDYRLAMGAWVGGLEREDRQGLGQQQRSPSIGHHADLPSFACLPFPLPAGLPDYWIELLKHVVDEDW